MWSTAREIAAGDTVILWLTRDALQPLTIEPGKEYNSKFGSYRHSDLVGIPYGSKVGSRTGKGFIHVLRPTPELWTMALPHRTQILYLADISFITSYLNIKSGSRVVEAGTGSGSFSHSVMRTIGPSGHLWSYEFHETRANKARSEFNRHGLSERVTLTHRNVCKDGFTIEDTADALFLDIPAPWEAIEHAKKALRKDRIARVCCFSPCMEQVLRTVSALNDAGFSDITMYETLLRPYDIQQTTALPSVSTAAEKIKLSEAKREDKRLRQIAAGHRGGNLGDVTDVSGSHAVPGPAPGSSSEEQMVAVAHGEKRKRISTDVDTDADAVDVSSELEAVGKRVKTEDEDIKMEDEEEVRVVKAEDIEQKVTLKKEEEQEGDTKVSKSSSLPNAAAPATPPMPAKVNLSKVMPEVRGHTSYLTFACLLPPHPELASATTSVSVSESASPSASTSLLAMEHTSILPVSSEDGSSSADVGASK